LTTMRLEARWQAMRIVCIRVISRYVTELATC
jgi:hypothetical protein